VIRKAVELYETRAPDPDLLDPQKILNLFRQCLDDAVDDLKYNDSERALFKRFLCCYWYDYKYALLKPRRRS
jgi:hypothetical protein